MSWNQFHSWKNHVYSIFNEYTKWIKRLWWPFNSVAVSKSGPWSHEHPNINNSRNSHWNVWINMISVDQMMCCNFKAEIMGINCFLKSNKNELKHVPLNALNIIQYCHYSFSGCKNIFSVYLHSDYVSKMKLNILPIISCLKNIYSFLQREW